MRIISGQYGGRALISPKDRSVRPTSDKVRGAIFNMIGSRMDISGVSVLDGFCGSGALGLEALSRGAAHCTFVDKSIALCEKNVVALGAEDHVDWVKTDMTKMPSCEPFDLVLLDPPYEQGLAEAALTHLIANQMIAGDALIVVEESRYVAFNIPDGLTIESDKIYGDTKVYLLKA